MLPKNGYSWDLPLSFKLVVPAKVKATQEAKKIDTHIDVDVRYLITGTRMVGISYSTSVACTCLDSGMIEKIKQVVHDYHACKNAKYEIDSQGFRYSTALDLIVGKIFNDGAKTGSVQAYAHKSLPTENPHETADGVMVFCMKKDIYEGRDMEEMFDHYYPEGRGYLCGKPS